MFGTDRHRVKATPAGIAATLAEGVIRGTNLLRQKLEEEGCSRAMPKRFSSEQCILECLLFEWFLRDIVVSAEFGRQADAIRHALQRRILGDLGRSGLSPAILVNFDTLHGDRFAEYRVGLEASSSLQALGALAWQRIQEGDDPSERMTMLLARRALGELGALRGLATRYTVIGPFTA